MSMSQDKWIYLCASR